MRLCASVRCFTYYSLFNFLFFCNYFLFLASVYLNCLILLFLIYIIMLLFHVLCIIIFETFICHPHDLGIKLLDLTIFRILHNVSCNTIPFCSNFCLFGSIKYEVFVDACHFSFRMFGKRDLNLSTIISFMKGLNLDIYQRFCHFHDHTQNKQTKSKTKRPTTCKDEHLLQQIAYQYLLIST